MNKKVIKLLLIAVLFVIAGTVYCCTHTGSTTSSTDTLIIQEETFLKEPVTIYDPVEETEPGIWIYVSGEVKFPGVYFLGNNSRIYEAIESAGGVTENAAEGYMNLAALLVDGQHIVVPDKDSFKNEEQTLNDLSEGSVNKGLVNINTASAEELKSLPGIGDARAADIISYREKNKFRVIEDIMNVSGIKESLFNKIKELITV